MLLSFRLVVTSLAVFATYGRALSVSNFTTNEAGCGTSGLTSQAQWTKFDESLAQAPNTTKRQEGQKHRIPTHITVLAKDSTVEGGNITDSQIQQVLEQLNKFFSYGFFLDTSVDTIHRYTRPELFDRNSGMFTGKFDDIQRQYHRGEGDYASLNIIFVFRLGDWYKVETTWSGTRTSSGGVMGRSSVPSTEIWHYSNALDLEKSDGMILSSAVVPGVAYPGHQGSLNTFPHEFGHWVGLKHTDYSEKSAGGKAVCDPVNDNIDDTPTHILEENVKRALLSCPPRNQIKTCQNLDSRSDPIYNLMVSINFGCESDGLTNGQIQRTLQAYRKFRMPYKQQMQQKGQWVQSQDQPPQEQPPQEQPPQEQPPQDQPPQDQPPQHRPPQNEQGDWLQKEVARLNSESQKNWDKFRQQRADYHQQIQSVGQQNFNGCLNQVQQWYDQGREGLGKSMQEKYKQLQDYDEQTRQWIDSYRQYPEWTRQELARLENEVGEWRQTYEQEERKLWGDLQRNSQQHQLSCRQSAQEEETRQLETLEAWEKKYVQDLQDEDRRMGQYLNSLWGNQQ